MARATAHGFHAVFARIVGGHEASIALHRAFGFEVIGVVTHQRHTTMMNDGEEATFFTDGYAQFGAAFRWAVRTSGDPNAIVATVRNAITQQDPRLLITLTTRLLPWGDR